MSNYNQARPAPTITATPERTLVDEPVQIHLSGCIPNEPITLRARTMDGERKQFESHAVFLADDQGKVDVSRQKPLSGSYEDTDLMGLFWSMNLADSKKRAFFIKTKSTPLTVTLSVEINGDTLANVEVVRVFFAPNVTKTQVEEQGIIGALYQPKDPGPYPGVLVLSGSDGGSREDAAALLAAHGYAVLALAYFGVEDLPKHLENIPLEYFETAIHWLQKQPGVSDKQIAVIGLSRGGELALLLGSTFHEIGAVIAGSPSGVIYSGLRNNMPVAQPGWTYRGEPFPYLRSKFSFIGILDFYGKWVTHRPVTNRAGFLKTLKDKTKVELASIPVERIQGPVMLISGGDDQLWPSSLFARMVMERLSSHKHPFQDVHLNYEGAGHFLCFPYSLPYLPPNVMMSPGGGILISFGGSAAANAHAAIDSWPQILTFLETSLSPEPPK